MKLVMRDEEELQSVHLLEVESVFDKEGEIRLEEEEERRLLLLVVKELERDVSKCIQAARERKGLCLEEE